MKKNSFGRLGEDYAASMLEKRGYKVIDRNFRNKFGEIDIIALDADTLVFVEVKTRNGKKHGNPYEAVGPTKLKKIKNMGSLYKRQNENLPNRMRVDVVSLITEGNRVVEERLIKIN
jgi:putative endonuclease